MPPAVELPTEILCAIFEISTSQFSLSPSLMFPASTAETRRALRLPFNVTGSDFCALPSLKDLTLHCLALSHVCSRWRQVAVDMQSLWALLHIGSNAVKRHLERTTAALLARSSPLPLFLDIAVQEYSDLEPNQSCIRDTLHEHVHRCHSLRIVSSDLIITDIFDAFVDHTLSNLPIREDRSLLTKIHVVQTSTTLLKPSFPSNLNLVAPSLVSLRSCCASISTYPRWRLQDVFIEEIHLSYHNHFHLFMQTPTKRLILHRIIIPIGTPYVRRVIDQKKSSVVSLVLSELQCIGPAEEKQNLYSTFFTLSLCPNLQELELAGLDSPALSGLLEFLRPSPPLVFSELRKLTLRGIDIPRRATVLTMASAFPALSEMVLESTLSGASTLVYDTWMSLHGIWPQLHEIVLNGEVVRRR